MNVTVVLARPKEPRNIGACCRAAKNFGCRRIAVVGNPTFDRDAARGPAIGADDLLDGIVCVPTLSEALAGFHLAVGYTRRHGQRRKTWVFAPWELARRLSGQEGAEVALVFGNETSGLSDEELALCHMAVFLPTDEACPSMNLSHAVAVALYELRTYPLRPRPSAEAGEGTTAGGGGHGGAGEAGGTNVGAPATTGTAARAVEIDGAVVRITTHLEALGFHVQDGPQGLPQLMRDILGRATPAPIELERFAAMFEKLAGMHGSGRGR